MRGRRYALLGALTACGLNPAYGNHDPGTSAATTSTTTTAIDPADSSDTGITPTTAAIPDPTTTSSDPSSTSSTTTAVDTTTSPATTTTDATTGDLDPACPGDKGLVACYHFPAGETELLIDGSPAKRHGTLATVALVDSLFDHGTAAQFNESTRATVDHDPAFNTANFTISAFVYVQSQNRAVIDMQDRYALFVDNGQATCIVRGPDPGVTSVPAPIVLDEWLHLACTYDGVDLRIHVHRAGFPVTNNPTSWTKGVNITNQSDFAVGRDDVENGAFYVGLLDHVLVHDRALTPPELCALAVPLCDP